MSPDNILFCLGGFFGGMAFLMVVQAVADWRERRAWARYEHWRARRDRLMEGQAIARQAKRI